ncbi:nucleoside triphosphate pyrophosphohydrolase family protein [Aquitalea magnusonii]|uniref:Putative HAD superfamily Cof-like phosphohydrolase n=1 Tax=Aquitalea magnusonii TaxID=332411 RepID=A0A318JVD7_9NEIS|nr:nucleoside triphosphate pyrophosphohydrolase family protein [Aquitalea magnusonii]PXX48804.1 putative HAD superfamily Cof-like phosphohydrolase [Aquitalea magnusonii]
MSNLYAIRRDFMQQFDLPAPATPGLYRDTLPMWETMLQEEMAEFLHALQEFKQSASCDPQEQVRRMAELTAEGVDVLNVLTGLLLSQGMPLEAMTEAIHQANLRKQIDGKVVRRADGKVLKPAGWQPADKCGVIRAALQHDKSTAQD